MHEHDANDLLLLHVASDAGEDAVITSALEENGVPFVHMEMHASPYPAKDIEGYSRIMVLDENAKRAHEVVVAALGGREIPPPSKHHQQIGQDDSRKPAKGHGNVGQIPPRHRSR